MINMKKLGALALTGAMAVSMLTGCGGGKKDDDGKITITMMYSGSVSEDDFETTVLPDLVAKEFPNINLEVEKIPDDQYYTSLKTKLASGECPDIILVQPMYAGSNAVITLAEAGYLEPLTDMEAIAKNPVGAKSFTYDGEVYGIPSGVTILGTYYNKDIFAEYNLEVPTTWSEFLDVCETLKANDVQPIVMGDKDMYVMQFGLYQLACNEVYANDADFDESLRTGETSFTDDDTWDTVLEMYTELYDNGYISENSLGLGATQANQEFIDGKAAMVFDGSFDLATVTQKGAADFERGYFPLPAENGDTYAAMAAGAGPAIYAKSEYKDECKQILEMLYDGESEMYKAYVDSGRIIPTYGYGSDSVDPIYDTFMKLYEEGKAFYWANQAWPAGVETEMETLLSEYIGGQGTTVEDITQGMQDKFDELYTGE